MKWFWDGGRPQVIRLGPFPRSLLIALDWASYNFSSAEILDLGYLLSPMLCAIFYDMVAMNAWRFGMVSIHNYFKRLSWKALGFRVVYRV